MRLHAAGRRPATRLGLAGVAVAIAAAWGPAHADPLAVTPDPGLKLRADSTQMIELPLSDRWALQSSVRMPAAVSPRDGLKLGLQGNYGFNVGQSHRLSLSAGLGLTDDSQVPSISMYDPATQRFTTTSGSSFGTQRKDLLLDFHWDWELTATLSLNSSLGLSHAIGPVPTDPAGSNFGAPVQPGATSAGFVGLKLKF